MKRASLSLLLLLALPARLFASCGSSSCPIELRPFTDVDRSRFVFDLSFQYIDQNRLRFGTGPGTFSDAESDHDELQTINRITTAQFGWLATPRLQLAATLPFVSRSHRHIEVESSELETWSFGALGDASLQAQFRTLPHLWLSGSVKFPTGETGEADSAGEVAEVTIQPGSGSTDFTIGATYQSTVVRDTTLAGEMGHATALPYFVSLSARRNGRGTSDYRRGDELQLNAGTEYPIAPHVDLLAQVNARQRAKDDVGSTDEHPDLTGGTWLYLSPGLRFVAGRATSVYSYIQLPLYQHVNGLQLVARRNYLIGIQQRF
ncbi:MAG: hypothetical protein JO197_04375 [Acidobacteria bacterium]|nr:hypothetical protein [Acidobacteriota bacterium]MBV9478549.1 hypothetical protein [Acidobacteriota bacterium]